MKRSFLLIILIILVSGCDDIKEKYSANKIKLTVYCGEPFYSTDIWKGFSYFEARYNCEIEIINFKEPYQALKRIMLEADSSNADLICGINSALESEAVSSGLFLEYQPEQINYIDKKFYFDKSNYFIPYAYGYLALLYDSRYIKEAPVTYGELQDSKWNDTLIMPDPFHTAMGRAFLHMTVAQYGKNGFRYLWKGIRKNIRLYPENYDDAFSRMLAGEGHMIPGYSSTPVFLQQKDDSYYIRKVEFKEGSFMVTELAGILKNSDQQALAKRFIDHLLSEEFQKRISQEKWMYPVRRDIELNPLIADIEEPAADNLKAMTLEKIANEESLWLKKLKKTLK